MASDVNDPGAGDRNVNRGGSTIRRVYGAITDRASTEWGRRPSVAPVGQPPTPTVPAWWRGVGACRRHAPPMPHRVCALRDRRAPSIRSIRVRTVTVPLRDGLFRGNVHATPV